MGLKASFVRVRGSISSLTQGFIIGNLAFKEDRMNIFIIT